MWRRKYILRCRRNPIKSICLLSVFLVIIIFTLMNSHPMSTGTADAELEIFIASHDTPSRISVLPDQNTVVRNPENHCNLGNGSQVFALFMVISSPTNKVARDIIRTGFKFYLRDHDVEISSNLHLKRSILLFFIGQPTTLLGKRKLLAEATLFNDLIIDDLEESYYNLTLKSLRMLKWVEHNCYHSDFTVKIDDDVHINLKKLLSLLEFKSRENTGKDLVGGTLKVNDVPIRDPSSIYGKWYTPLKLWSRDTFPDYVAGYFYVLGKDARTKIYQAALFKPLFHLEDVFITGIVTEMLGLKLTEFSKISHWWTLLRNFITSSCDIQSHYFAVHFHSKVYNYLNCWKRFNEKNFSCSVWPLFFTTTSEVIEDNCSKNNIVTPGFCDWFKI